MRIYLDNCCYNRPYDSQDQFSVSMETRAKLHIQDEIRDGLYELVDSYMLEYENSCNPDDMKRNSIQVFREEYRSFYVPDERHDALNDKIAEIMAYGIHFKDAVHAACAIYAGCAYLLTTDIKFSRKYSGSEIEIVNPVDFIRLEEGEEK